MLQSLLELAENFALLEAFVRDHGDAAEVRQTQGSSFVLRGLYVESVCEGLRRVLLPYRQALARLERDILDNPKDCSQLTSVQYALAPYQPLLLALTTLVKQLQLRKAHGCYILDIVYKATFSGVAKVQEAMKILLHEGHKVLYKQLLGWILQGRLFDPYNEFFIAEEAQSRADNTTNRSSHLLAASADGQSASHTNTTTSTNKAVKSYSLRAAMVPGHISIKLAEKIFFIGESIQLFEGGGKGSGGRFQAQGCVLKERETEFYQKMATLRDQPEFLSGDFERFVEGVSSTASRHLHDLLMGVDELKGPDLRKELILTRDFFFLVRGELFHTFIEQADIYLSKPPTATTQHDVNQAFLAACRAILPDDEAASRRVKVVVATNSLDSTQQSALSAAASAKPVGWRCVGLSYSVPWPLHLVITERALEEYNRVFRFLLTVRRTQQWLHRVWAAETTADRRHRALRQQPRDESWRRREKRRRLRLHMTLVVDNLQQYFVADVLGAQCERLDRRVAASVDFEDLKMAHDDFLAAVSSQTFVNYKPVHQCLNELLSVCLHFAKYATEGRESDDESRLNQLCLTFSRQSGFLFQLLGQVRNQQQGCHLAQLLLRIDFNRYFSKHGHDVGNIA